MPVLHDTTDTRPPVVDLLYPSEEKRRAGLKRKAALEELPTNFVKDLMLEQLADQLTPHYQYKMVGLFAELSDDVEVISYRQDILDDLIGVPAISGTLRKVVSIMLTNDKSNIYKLSTPDSFTQLDSAVQAFEAYIRCMELMHKLYLENKDKVKSEGVKKLFAFFEGNYSDKHYTRLKKETEQLRAAMTGKIRSVTVAVNFNENLVPISVGLAGISDKSWESSPSVFDRIISLGAKNSDHTVMHELKERFREDGRDVLTTTDKELFEALDSATKKYVKTVEDVLDEYQAIGFEDMYAIEYQLDFYTGVVGMIENARAKGLEMCRPKILPAEKRCARIEGLFDPIYFHEANVWNLNHSDKRSVVTNDISFDENAGFYVLTGANNGGKTTFVRAVGICQVMAQAGFYVPAKYCEISLTDCIYTHFPKEEQTGIDSSRFTTEIKEFKAISDVISSRSLLLMNESIQSTTPRECVDIAGQLMRIFCIMGVRGVFATHLGELAEEAQTLRNEPNVRTKPESLVVSVNEQTGERLYKVVKGMPTQTSFASTIFEKYGLDIKALEKKAEKEERKSSQLA
jgi:DNA mismatch repair ATPase MutS